MESGTHGLKFFTRALNSEGQKGYKTVVNILSHLQVVPEDAANESIDFQNIPDKWDGEDKNLNDEEGRTEKTDLMNNEEFLNTLSKNHLE